MPNIKSAKKRVEVAQVRTLRNKAAKSALRTAIKKADLAIASQAEDREVLLKAACRKIDKNNAAHKKSRLTKAAAKAQA